MRKIATTTKIKTIVANIYRDADTDEYAVKLFVDGKHYEPADYFTSDREDAINTADAMVKHRAQ